MTTNYHGSNTESPIEEIYAIIDSLKSMTDSINQELDSTEEDADWRDDWADAARRGEYGDDWRIVQRRIDKEETTLDAVLMGEDKSPEAQHIRETSEERMSTFEDELDDEDKERLDSLRDELSGAAQSLQERIENLTQQLKGL